MIESDVVVIGAGVMGAATTYALARAGASVTLLEQFTLGHKRGSSHGRSRIFRLSYPEPAYVDMALQARPLWREFEAFTGAALLTTTGGLEAGFGVESNAAALESCDVDFELMSGSEVRSRWADPFFEDDETVLFQADSGIVAADDAVRTFAEVAQGLGARLVQETRVEGLDLQDDTVVVEAGGDGYRAPVAVVTAGGWARELLAGIDITLEVRPTRETVAYFSLDGPAPPTFVEWGEPTVYSLLSPGQGIKVGQHIGGPITNARDEGSVNEESIERLRSWVARRWPSAESQPLATETCIYTNTIDEHFVLERHGPVVVGSACSGHGFKFAPLIGARLAALALE